MPSSHPLLLRSCRLFCTPLGFTVERVRRVNELLKQCPRVAAWELLERSRIALKRVAVAVCGFEGACHARKHVLRDALRR